MPLRPPDDAEPLNLRAYRALMLLAAVGVPGFWVLDHLNGMGYADPFAYRIGLSGLALTLVGATYVSRWARDHVRGLTIALIYLGSAYLSTTATANGLPAPWSAGLLLMAGTGGLTISMFAVSRRQIGWSLAGFFVAVAVPLFVTPVDALDHSPLTFAVELAVAMAAVYVAGATRLRTLEVLAESRRQLEAERDQGEQRERLLRTVMDSIPDAIYVNDLEGRCVMRNQASADGIEQATGLKGLGQTAFDLFDAQEAQRDWDDHQHVVQTGEPAAERLATVDWGGQEAWYEHAKVPLLTSSGEVIGVVGVARDVTMQKAAERELIQARDTAQAAARVKAEFLANMSHEIRTPMNGVIGMADVLAESDLTADQGECVRTIQTCADALLALISDVLDLSKIEADGVEIERVEMRPRDVVRDALDVVRTAARARGLTLAVDVDESVPAVVLGDPTRIRQVLLNLLSNAVKFTHQGGVSVRVGALVPPDALGPCRLRFAVQDTGVGIAPDKRAGLFDAFTQADASTTRRYGGTGLGLAISSRLVALMGGTIEIDDQPGDGSTFTFDVRVEAVPAPQQTPPEPRPARSPPTGVGGGLRVLVVEDNEVNQLVIVRLLERLGVQADVADHGRAALAALHQAADAHRAYDVVLMDVQMPVMDGHEATRRLRHELAPSAQPHVIALTANAMAGDREACLDAGADEYLTKPVRRDALETALDASRERRLVRPAA